MSELISKENLIKAIVNTPTNEQANTMQGYLDGIATRQLEIIDIINSLQTVSEQEIRDKAIDTFVKEAMNQFVEFNLEHGYPTVTDCEIILKEIAEQMKEVGE